MTGGVLLHNKSPATSLSASPRNGSSGRLCCSSKVSFSFVIRQRLWCFAFRMRRHERHECVWQFLFQCQDWRVEVTDLLQSNQRVLGLPVKAFRIPLFQSLLEFIPLNRKRDVRV